MEARGFILEIDGRRVIVKQEEQNVEILDDSGNVAFCEQIQVAAGSIQGLFMALSDGVHPERTA